MKLVSFMYSAGVCIKSSCTVAEAGLVNFVSLIEVRDSSRSTGNSYKCVQHFTLKGKKIVLYDLQISYYLTSDLQWHPRIRFQ